MNSELKNLVFEALDNAKHNCPETLEMSNCNVADQLKTYTSGFENYKALDVISYVALYKNEQEGE